MRYDVSLFADQDLYLFNEGSHYRLYEKLGSHFMTVDGEEGTYFAVWAPNAENVYVTGSFNGWNKSSHPLRTKGVSGIWEGFIPGVMPGTGCRVAKAAPFAFHGEAPPDTGSVVWDLWFEWGDGEWMKDRVLRNGADSPISIYEAHLGSWMRVPEEGNRMLSYRELGPGPSPLPQGRPRPHLLRRAPPLRARRPAAGAPPRLGHADLQLRPPRGAELPSLRCLLLACRLPPRRASRR